jgi:tetratricopeptide (TPR) repeat protein
MGRITLWRCIGALLLAVVGVSLLPGRPGLREMAADIRAGWLFDRAVEQLRQRDYAGAEALFKRTLACRPGSPSFRGRVVELLVASLVQQRKWIECAALIESSLAHGLSLDGRLRLTLAICYDQVHDFRRAEKIYLDYLKSHPDDPVACNDLAYHYAQRGIRLDEALELVKQALAKDPYSGPTLDTLGWLYYRKGWLRQAEVALLQAQQLTPPEDRAEVLYHLGAVYAEMGRYPQALRFLNRALQLQPDFPEAVELLEKIRPHVPRPGDVTA